MERLKALRERVCQANRRLYSLGLVILTEGNVSERKGRFMAIKPSGVAYEELTPSKMVVLEIEKGVALSKNSSLVPSTDTPTHLAIYRAFPEIGAIAHTHSVYATIFAQMGTPIPCYGTTHADRFAGGVPVTRKLREEEVRIEYESNTGKVIAEILSPEMMPAVLVYGHGPFTVGLTSKEAVDTALILEKVAQMALMGKQTIPLPLNLITKHFYRKIGSQKYYGQK